VTFSLCEASSLAPHQHSHFLLCGLGLCYLLLTSLITRCLVSTRIADVIHRANLLLLVGGPYVFCLRCARAAQATQAVERWRTAFVNAARRRRGFALLLRRALDKTLVRVAACRCLCRLPGAPHPRAAISRRCHPTLLRLHLVYRRAVWFSVAPRYHLIRLQPRPPPASRFMNLPRVFALAKTT